MEKEVAEWEDFAKEVWRHNVESWKEFMAFVEDVNWTEPWLVALGGLHLLLLLVILSTRNQFYSQLALWAFLLGTVFSAEWINTWCMHNWQRFATQPYFSANGAFISLVLCAPFILLSLVITINFLRMVVQMMVVVKRAQLRNKKKEE
ncbi:hypothetical protein QOT17_000198 [Balamuthia mandrillaris]